MRFIVIALSSLLLATPALAQEAEPPPPDPTNDVAPDPVAEPPPPEPDSGDEANVEADADARLEADVAYMERPAEDHVIDEDEIAPAEDPPVFLFGARFGVFLPQVFNKLSTSFILSLWGGYVIPAIDYRLVAVFELGYTQPPREDDLDDPRLAAGSYHYDLTQHDFTMFLGAHYYFAPLRDQLVPYAGIGLRAHLLKSVINGDAGGMSLLENQETSTRFGGAIRGGVGYTLGPGHIALDVELALAPLDHLITGESNIGDLFVAASYQFVM